MGIVAISLAFVRTGSPCGSWESGDQYGRDGGEGGKLEVEWKSRKIWLAVIKNSLLNKYM